MKAGDVFENPLTGMRVVVLQTPDETGGRAMQIEYHHPPYAGRDAAPPHRHRIYVERFEILAGRAGYVVGDEEHVAEVGQTVVVPEDTTHVHPWSISDEELVVRQTTEATPPDGKAMTAALVGVRTRFGLTREGKVDAHGQPSLLQSAVILNALLPNNYLPGVPLLAQRVVFGVLAAVGQLLGYRLSYPRFEGRAEPAPSAVAATGEAG